MKDMEDKDKSLSESDESEEINIDRDEELKKRRKEKWQKEILFRLLCWTHNKCDRFQYNGFNQ